MVYYLRQKNEYAAKFYCCQFNRIRFNTPVQTAGVTLRVRQPLIADAATLRQ